MYDEKLIHNDLVFDGGLPHADHGPGQDAGGLLDRLLIFYGDLADGLDALAHELIVYFQNVFGELFEDGLVVFAVDDPDQDLAEEATKYIF